MTKQLRYVPAEGFVDVDAGSLGAGAHAASMSWLLEGAQRRRIRGEPALARALLRQHDRAADALGWDADDGRRALGWARTARVALHQGDLAEADRLSRLPAAHWLPAVDTLVANQRHLYCGGFARVLAAHARAALELAVALRENGTACA